MSETLRNMLIVWIVASIFVGGPALALVGALYRRGKQRQASGQRATHWEGVTFVHMGAYPSKSEGDHGVR